MDDRLPLDPDLLFLDLWLDQLWISQLLIEGREQEVNDHIRDSRFHTRYELWKRITAS